MISSFDPLILGDELMVLVRERLASGNKVRYLPFAGVSMLPMLRQKKDTVELAPLPEKLKKYDLPVYRYPSGKYVMHRVVAVKDDHYVCLGDNTMEYETIYPEMLIGVVSAFKRGEKRIEVDNWGYRLYSRVWVAIFPLRKFLRRTKQWLRKLIRG
jgi:hypothetical protein